MKNVLELGYHNLASLDQTVPRRGRRDQEAGSPPRPPPVPPASFPSPRAELLSAGGPTPGKAARVSSRSRSEAGHPGRHVDVDYSAHSAVSWTVHCRRAMQRNLSTETWNGRLEEPWWTGQPCHQSQAGNGMASSDSAPKAGLFKKQTHCSARAHRRDKATRESLPPLTLPVPSAGMSEPRGRLECRERRPQGRP